MLPVEHCAIIALFFWFVVGGLLLLFLSSRSAINFFAERSGTSQQKIDENDLTGTSDFSS